MRQCNLGHRFSGIAVRGGPARHPVPRAGEAWPASLRGRRDRPGGEPRPFAGEGRLQAGSRAL